jgi:hypothetical protein
VLQVRQPLPAVPRLCDLPLAQVLAERAEDLAVNRFKPFRGSQILQANGGLLCHPVPLGACDKDSFAEQAETLDAFGRGPNATATQGGADVAAQ